MLRKLLIVFGVLLILLGLILGILLTGPVQTWIARQVVPDQSVAFERVRVWPHSVQVTNFAFRDAQIAVAADRVVVDVSLLSLLGGGAINLREVAMEGLNLDLSRLETRPEGQGMTVRGQEAASGEAAGSKPTDTPAVAEGDGPAYPGLFRNVPIERGLRLERLRVDGRVRLSEQQAFQFQFSGDNLGSHVDQNRLTGEATFVDLTPEARVDLLAGAIELVVAMAAPYQPEKIAATLRLEGTGPGFGPPGRAGLEARLTAFPEGDQEVYDLSLKARDPVSGDLETLLELAASVDVPHQRVEGALSFALTSGWIAPYLEGLGISLPVFDLDGQSVFDGTVAGDTLAWNGRISGSIAASPVSLRTRLQMQAGQLAEAEGRLELLEVIDPETGNPLDLEVKVLPLSLDSGTGRPASIPVLTTLERAGLRSAVLTVANEFRQDGTPARLDVSGNRVAINDFAALGRGVAAWFPGEEPVEPEPSASGPVWPAWSGMVDLDLKTLILPGGLKAAPVRASVVVEPTSIDLTLEQLVMNEGVLTGTARLVNHPDRTDRPWSATSRARLDDLHLGGLLTALGLLPEQVPLTGRLDGDWDLSAEAATLPQLADRLAGGINLRAADGVVRLLNPEDKLGAAALGGGIGASIFGELTGDRRISALGRMIPYFSEIPFLDFDLSLTREAGGLTEVSALALQADALMVRGGGRLDAPSLVEALGAPMQLDLTLGSRGQLSTLAARLGLLSDQQADGYTVWNLPVTLRGTLKDPDAGQLWSDLLGKAREQLLPAGSTGGAGESRDAVGEGARLLRGLLGNPDGE
ncbi:MAG: hypothetical protein ACFE0O_14575 [Opitutales bacterium]